MFGRKDKISLLCFLISAVLFLLNIKYVFTYSETVFWVCVLLFLITIIYQIFYLRTSPRLVLAEIFLVYVFLHLVYQIGYIGLRGSDSYFDYDFLTTILSERTFTLGDGPRSVGGWPMIHIFSAEVFFFTGIDTLTIAKFLPTLLASILLYPLYLLTSSIYKDSKVSLFVCLVFGTIPQFMSFEGLYVREVFAVLMTVYFIYVLYRFRKSSDYKYAVILLIIFPTILLSHHFTALILAIFISIYGIVTMISFRQYKDNKRTVLHPLVFIFLFTVFAVILLGYLAFQPSTRVGIERIISAIFGQYGKPVLSRTMNLDAPIVTLAGKIIFYGFYFFHFLFAGVLVAMIYLRRYREKIEELSFSLFFFFYGIYGFIALYVLGSLLNPERLQTLGWMLGIIPLGSSLFFFKKDWHKKIFVVILVLFMCYNIYNIDPSYRSRELQRIDNIAGDKEYIIAYTIQFPEGFTSPGSQEKYYGYGGVVAAIYHIQGIMQRDQGRNWLEIIDLSESGRIVILKEKVIVQNLEAMKEKAPRTYEKYLETLSYKNAMNIHKIGDLGDPYVLKGGN